MLYYLLFQISSKRATPNQEISLINIIVCVTIKNKIVEKYVLKRYLADKEAILSSDNQSTINSDNSLYIFYLPL